MTKAVFHSLMLCLLSLQLAVAQPDSTAVKFRLVFGGKPLELNKPYISKSQDTLQISVFRFYISNVAVRYVDGITFKESESHHLIDLEDIKSQSFRLALRHQEIAKVSFDLGVDSTASVSGALSGDLDPTKGMYWACKAAIST